MAAPGLWVKVAATVPRHYKTEALARALALPIHEVVGKLVSLWIYAVEFANSGLLTRDDIRRGFFAADEPCDEESVTTVINALRDCGLPGHLGFIEELSITDEDMPAPTCYALHDWARYSGTYQPEASPSYKKKRKKDYVEKEVDEESPPPARAVMVTTPATAIAKEPESKASSLKEEPHLPKLPVVREPLLESRGENYRAVYDKLRHQMHC